MLIRKEENSTRLAVCQNDLNAFSDEFTLKKIIRTESSLNVSQASAVTRAESGVDVRPVSLSSIGVVSMVHSSVCWSSDCETDIRITRPSGQAQARKALPALPLENAADDAHRHVRCQAPRTRHGDHASCVTQSLLILRP